MVDHQHNDCSDYGDNHAVKIEAGEPACTECVEDEASDNRACNTENNVDEKRPRLRALTVTPTTLLLLSAVIVEVKAERSVMRPYPTGGGGREMSGDDHHGTISKGLEETSPCCACRLGVNTEAAVELGFGALQRRVHNIA